MLGYASDETLDLMPMLIRVARKLAVCLAKVRREGTVSEPRPDRKTQVSVVYEDNASRVSSTVVASIQHNPDRTQAELRTIVEAEAIKPVLDDLGVDVGTPGVEVLVDSSGNFVAGGPAADFGLMGRELTVDTYGGVTRHGGGAFSGKDPFKMDRSVSYTLRWITKNIVVVGSAKHCEIQISYAIG